MDQLVLKRAAASRLSGHWYDDDYDVLCDGIVVGRIFNAAASPVGTPWMWTLAYGYHEDRTPTHGYAATREAAMDPPCHWRERRDYPQRPKIPRKSASFAGRVIAALEYRETEKTRERAS